MIIHSVPRTPRLGSIGSGLAISALVLAACGGATSPTGTPGGGSPQGTQIAAGSTPGTGGAADACSVITSAEAGALLGQGTATAQPGAAAGGFSICTFSAGGKDVIVNLDKTASAKATFDALKSQPGTTAISGLGDDAFWLAAGGGNVSLNALKGGTGLAIGFGSTSTAAAGSPEQQAMVAALKALMATALTRI